MRRSGFGWRSAALGPCTLRELADPLVVFPVQPRRSGFGWRVAGLCEPLDHSKDVLAHRVKSGNFKVEDIVPMPMMAPPPGGIIDTLFADAEAGFEGLPLGMLEQ